MAFEKSGAITAIGFCVGLVPSAVFAQAAVTGPQLASTFVPVVESCVTSPTAETCEPVRALVAECAAELEYDQCEVLFNSPDEVFSDEARTQQVKDELTQTSDAIAEMTFEASEGGSADVDESNRADSERTFLRGDENLNSHSSPPLVDAETNEP